MTETNLQQELDDAVLARAYGFAFPAAVAGICAGSAVTAPLVAVAGLVPALSMVAVSVAGYAFWIVLGIRIISLIRHSGQWHIHADYTTAASVIPERLDSGRRITVASSDYGFFIASTF